MRPSNRTAIVEAAHRVAGRHGAADFSYEATATEAGLTKAGVLYHFPSREDLVLAVVGHVARTWESAMLDALGTSFDRATPAQRVRAYVLVAAGDELSRGDVAIWADALCRPAHAGPWNELFARWFDLADCPPDERTRLTCARLAADGLWVARATHSLAPAGADHVALVEHLLELTGAHGSVGGRR